MNESESISATQGELPQAERLWTVEDVAQYLRLKEETVRGMVRRGLIPGYKVGRVWRFKRTQIEQSIQSPLENAEL
jgi:excisionase family DNA binding protein